MTARPLSIVFAGGGTGGHLYPGLAIAEAIKTRKADAVITFIGTKDKIEARVVPATGFGFIPITVVGFRRRLALSNVFFPFIFLKALAQSFYHLRRIRPSVVVGTGGYVSGPPLLVATWLGIPTLVQEQNSYPGVTTRMLAKRATQIHITFPESIKYFARRNQVFISGNPTRASIGRISREDGARKFDCDPAKKTICVFGGSLGAASINAAAALAIQQWKSHHIQVVWQTGPSEYETVIGSTEVRKAIDEGIVKVYPFIDAMEYAYAASDLAVCRAGATTLAELTRAGLPSVLIPYPHAAADHQTVNARTMESAGAAIVCADSDAREKLGGIVTALIAGTQQLRTMADAARSLGKPEAAGTIAEAVLGLAGGT